MSKPYNFLVMIICFIIMLISNVDGKKKPTDKEIADAEAISVRKAYIRSEEAPGWVIGLVFAFPLGFLISIYLGAHAWEKIKKAREESKEE